MESNYLICDDIKVGEIVLCDEEYRKSNEEPYKVEVIYVGQITALVKNISGHTWTVTRNRLTKINEDAETQIH